MKKLFIAATLIIGSSMALTSCTKDNVKPTATISSKTVAEKADIAKADITSTDGTTTTGL